MALSALILGCEPVLGSDAALEDGAVAESGPGPGSADANAGPLDASSGVDAEAPVPLDASSADASVLDSGTGLDAQATLDASGTDLDAQAPDASDAAAMSDSGLVRVRSGEVRWPVAQNQGSVFCPQQSLAFWKDETITLADPSAPGFVCDICPNPPYDDKGITTYYYQSDELAIRFDFWSVIQRGHSLQGFRDALQFATLMWKTAPRTPTAEGWTQFSTWDPRPTVEFISYEEPLLRVRLETVVYDTAVGFDRPVVPYPCFHGAPPLPDLCTNAVCGYATKDLENSGVHVTVDVTLRVQAPHDGLSPP